MRALCVGRHQYLSDHVGRYFRELGVDATCVVGLPAAAVAARQLAPDLVLGDYDLLATVALDEWEQDPVLARIPVIAVSLTRRPDEVHLLDRNAIAGFLYLPTLARDDALRLLAAMRPPAIAPYSLPSTLEWARPSTTAR